MDPALLRIVRGGARLPLMAATVIVVTVDLHPDVRITDIITTEDLRLDIHPREATATMVPEDLRPDTHPTEAAATMVPEDLRPDIRPTEATTTMVPEALTWTPLTRNTTNSTGLRRCPLPRRPKRP